MNAGQIPYPTIHRLMLERYGFGLFPLAAYRDVSVGGWRMVGYGAAPVEGYLSGLTMESRRHVLHQGRTAWMSTGLMEQESHAFHVHAARGTVVVAGLGMAMYAYAASLKPEVDRVVIVERSPEVIAIITEAAGLADWPESRKIRLIQADALSPDLAATVRAATEGQRPDYLYADIWAVCGAAEAPTDTATMVAHLDPVAAGWWGQELSLGQWCRAQGRLPDEPGLHAYARQAGVPIPVTSGYARFCQDVIAVQMPPRGPSFWSRLFGRKRS